GIKVGNGGKLRAEAANFPLEVLFLRDDDIPQYVADGVADIGIAGENVIIENAFDLPIAEKLGFAKCRLSLAVKREENYSGLSWLEGKKIATSYPAVLQSFLSEKGVAAGIEEISGSVEIAPSIGLAEAVCDIVSTGSTLLANGLKEVETIMVSEAVLVSNPDLPDTKQALLEKLLFRIRAVDNASRNKYILLNAPNNAIEEISRILPGVKSPTLLPLATEGWSSLHSVVREDDFWDVIDRLKSAGAEGILVCPIEKMVM
ncbi:MAG TPA: ATP phosphoribosyltransferase, partial [Cryomorphaceae bacterium]|nr:ATP phosphoribosyltransferase [Cryomorphaceae bacterium]